MVCRDFSENDCRIKTHPNELPSGMEIVPPGGVCTPRLSGEAIRGCQRPELPEFELPELTQNIPLM
jgi:hypothetical protein